MTMFSRRVVSVFLLNTLSIHAALTALTNVPPNLTSSENLGYATNDPFNPYMYRDGGGGGFINGFHVLSFSDSFTTVGPINGTLTSFVHNTFSYFGYVSPEHTEHYAFELFCTGCHASWQFNGLLDLLTKISRSIRQTQHRCMTSAAFPIRILAFATSKVL